MSYCGGLANDLYFDNLCGEGTVEFINTHCCKDDPPNGCEQKRKGCIKAQMTLGACQDVDNCDIGEQMYAQFYGAAQRMAEKNRKVRGGWCWDAAASSEVLCSTQRWKMGGSAWGSAVEPSLWPCARTASTGETAALADTSPGPPRSTVE